MLSKQSWGRGEASSPHAQLALAPMAVALLQFMSALSAWYGLAFASKLGDVSGLQAGQVRALACLGVFVLLVGFLIGVSDTSSGSLVARAHLGLARVWPAGLPLGLLPLCTGHWRLLPALLSVALAARYVPEGALARLSERRAWQWAMLGFAATLAVGFVAVGRALPGSTNNDAAYYFGMARYIARTHRFQEPIVWQFLNQAPSVFHRPFDYWHGFVSLFMVPIFALFGSSYRVAGTTMGLVSGSSLVLFAYLIAVAAPLRNAALQILALLLFAFSPALLPYRFDVETIPFVHLWLLVALIALAERRMVLASCSACLLFLFRADAATLSALLCLCAAYLAFQPGARERDWLRVVLTISAFALLYVGYHWLVFGTPGPPGALLAARLMDGTGPYCWSDAPAVWTLSQRFAAQFIADRVHVALDTLQVVSFFPNYPIWLGCTLLAAAPTSSPRRGLDWVARLVFFGGAAGTALASPAVFATWRSLHTLLPVFVLAGAYGAEALFDGMWRFLRARRARAGWARFSAGVSLLAFVMALLSPLRLAAAQSEEPAFTKELTAMDATFAGQTVMTARSWWVLAYTHTSAVALPFNGEEAMGIVLRRYHPKWLLIVNGETVLGSNDAVNELLAGRRDQIAGVHMQLQSRSSLLTLYSVQE